MEHIWEFYRKVLLEMLHVVCRNLDIIGTYAISWVPSVRVNWAKRGENQKGNVQFKVCNSISNSVQVRHKWVAPIPYLWRIIVLYLRFFYFYTISFISNFLHQKSKGIIYFYSRSLKKSNSSRSQDQYHRYYRQSVSSKSLGSKSKSWVHCTFTQL